MINRTFERITQIPIWQHLCLLGLCFLGFQWIKGKLDQSYLASGHPVDYFTGQTTFDGEKVKSFYQTMLDKGTLDIYWQTQFIDYGFMLGIFAIGLFASSFIARFSRTERLTHRIAKFGGLFLMGGAIFDALENLISFVMLSNPLGFSNWIALPYSLAAVLKFACIALGMLLLISTIVFLIIEKIRFARNSNS